MELWIGMAAFMGVIYYFDYKEKALKYKHGNKEPDEELIARIEALEKKCEKLQEQVNEAHQLLVDERRQLDQKLAKMLPDIPESSSEKSAAKNPVQNRTI